jgi:transcriptional regulator with PAS, ATPase and Fis domain
MIRVALISHYQKLADLFEETFAEHNREVPRQLFEREEYRLEILAVADHREAQQLAIDADVVVARGFMARAMMERDYFVPVVEIPVATNDLLRALTRARTLLREPRIAVIGSHSITMGVEELAQALGLSVRVFTWPSRQDEEAEGPLVGQVAGLGFNVVIGGMNTCAAARRQGMQAVFVESGRESIWHAITEAKRVGYISRREKEKSQNLSIVLNQSFDGVVALDPSGRVTLFNAMAEQLLRTPRAAALGKRLEALAGNPAFAALAGARGVVAGEVIKHGDLALAVNRAPIELEGEMIGALITVQDVTRIQSLEAKIRGKMQVRGLRARHTFDDILGESWAIRQAVQMAKRFSGVDSSILIVGETGTGKELFAQSIHNESPRRNGPFVAMNCASLSENLLESELFGYAAGAFTGAAREGRPGLFELAHLGTIFLDEISEISPRLQLLLLRVLQEREIMRLGDHKVIPVDVRVVASTNKELSSVVAQAQFRDDLYYRLDILRLDVPPLRERKEDIPLIAVHWVGHYAVQLRRERRTLSSSALHLLQQEAWPGNVRQLRNVCERLAVLGDAAIIEEADVRIALGRSDRQRRTPAMSAAPPAEEHERVRRIRPEEERQQILESLRKTRFSMSRTAAILRISRTTLWRRMKSLQISGRTEARRAAHFTP